MTPFPLRSCRRVLSLSIWFGARRRRLWAEDEWERLWHKATKPQKTKLKLYMRHYATRARHCTSDMSDSVSCFRRGQKRVFTSAWLLSVCPRIWLCLRTFRPILHQTKDSLGLFSCADTPLCRRYCNCQSETMQFIFCYTIILSKLWFSYNTPRHRWVPATVSG